MSTPRRLIVRWSAVTFSVAAVATGMPSQPSAGETPDGWAGVRGNITVSAPQDLFGARRGNITVSSVVVLTA